MRHMMNFSIEFMGSHGDGSLNKAIFCDCVLMRKVMLNCDSWVLRRFPLLKAFL